MDFSKIKEAYFIGIKGTGMAAMAEILKGRGIKVSGSDTAEKFFTDEVLERNHISFFEDFSEKHVQNYVDLFVHSTAYTKENNVEVAEVEKRGGALISYPELLGLLFREKLGIAVCGTHGKTTTTALLGEALRAAGKDPNALVGSQVIDWKSGVLSGKGDYFVAEADEYQNKLRFYDPWAVVLTSVDWDHPDFFPDAESYREVFRRFVSRIPKRGFLAIWGDSADTIEVSKSADCTVVTYGFGEDNDYRLVDYRSAIHDDKEKISEEISQSFEVRFGETSLGKFQLKLSGRHNALNATAAIAVCHRVGADLDKVREAFAAFHGTSRRFEFLGKYKGAILIDDYGHHPDEIKVTLAGAREKYPDKNIWAVFHPHTYSRTKALLHEFAQSFEDADKAIILDIYASAREKEGGVSSKDVVELMNRYVPGKADHIPTIDEAAEYLAGEIGKEDVVVLIGAGNVWEIGKKLLKK
ncbi:MAG: UDP-N-acetylmuramate-L-alanine ligase [Candidatus Moranbacteria bacterium GW2011_GWC2_45_10]|nr:MAG: UDP-N-acetylmuramate-L-alanine ligase [Candidatus Moranbacteria bacterium GW2011_GWC2_45_10]